MFASVRRISEGGLRGHILLERWYVAILITPKQLLSFGELLTSQLFTQESLPRLPMEKGNFTKEEFLEKVRGVDRKWS
jgi:hypothetical protein